MCFIVAKSSIQFYGFAGAIVLKFSDGFFSVLLGQRRENGTEFSNELIESQLPRSQLMLSHPKNAKHVLAAEVLCDDRSRF